MVPAKLLITEMFVTLKEEIILRCIWHMKKERKRKAKQEGINLLLYRHLVFNRYHAY